MRKNIFVSVMSRKNYIFLKMKYKNSIVTLRKSKKPEEIILFPFKMFLKGILMILAERGDSILNRLGNNYYGYWL